MFSFDFPPEGWARCAGQLLAINQNQALFSLLGTTYGGDGRTTFALPDLRDRAPMHFDPSGGTRVMGETGGESTHTLTPAELPTHTHAVFARPVGLTASPENAQWAGGIREAYAATPDTTMSAAAISSAGSGQPHENRPPYLVIQFGIATQGIFPSRN
jgi:microcystin-dependent protein